ncbi:MAG: hypothetical protein Q8R98_13565 [Rubrivivax sp.]|jgi:hypothetical protein|nr:hypothetical protein [Rubrivivax sp.]
MTQKQIAAGHVRRLRTIRKNLLQMAEQWADVDEFNISRLTELAQHAEEVAVSLVDEQEAA